MHALLGLIDQIGSHVVELGTGQGHVKVLRTGAVRSDEGQVDVGLHHAGKLDLSLFRSFLQTLHCHAVAGKVDAVALLELGYDIIHDALVEVVAAQTVVAVGCKNFKYAVAYLKDGYIKGAAAKIVHQYLLISFLIHAVCKRRRGRLVDYTKDFQTGNAARILGSLTLAVREVSRYGYNGLSYFFAQISFGVALQLLKDHCGYLLRSVILAVDMLLIAGSHLTLDGAYCTVRVGDSLALCGVADYTLVILKSNYGRSSTRAFRVGNNNGFAAFKNGYAGIGGTKVNTDNL